VLWQNSLITIWQNWGPAKLVLCQNWRSGTELANLALWRSGTELAKLAKQAPWQN
jgi:hypothetical protein